MLMGVYSNNINIDNWRAVGKYETGLILIADLSTYMIRNITLKYFHKIVGTNETISKKGYTIHTNLPCKKCSGTGYTDWVSEVIMNTKKEYGIDYKRGDSIFYKVKENWFYNNTVSFCYSTAYLSEQYKHCDECLGTGLHSIKTLLGENYKKIVVQFNF